MLDVVEESTPYRKYGVGALLYHAMTGTSTRFHSRAKQVLLLLMDNSIIGTFICLFNVIWHFILDFAFRFSNVEYVNMINDNLRL